MKEFSQTRQVGMKTLGLHYIHTHIAHDINDCTESVYNINDCTFIDKLVFHKRSLLCSYKIINIEKMFRFKCAHYHKSNIIKFSKLKRRTT